MMIGMIFYLFIITAGAVLEDHGACIHNEERGILNCRGSPFKSINFSDFDTKIFHTLDLGDNGISFEDLKQLLNIHARDQIKTILLDHNNISRFPFHLLNIFPNLESVDISYNNLTHISGRYCYLIAGLKELMIHGNCIHTPRNAFSCASHLILHIGNCETNSISNFTKSESHDDKLEGPFVNQEDHITTKHSIHKIDENPVVEEVKNNEKGSAVSVSANLHIFGYFVICFVLILG